MKPRLSITANPRTLVEDEGTETSIRVRSRGGIPSGNVLIDSNKNEALSKFAINPNNLQQYIRGGQIISREPDNSGFTIRMNRRTAVITFPVSDDNDMRPGIPGFNPPIVDRGRERTTFKLGNSSDYHVNEKRDRVTFTCLDSRPPLLPSADGVDERIEVADISGVKGSFSSLGAAVITTTASDLTVEDIGLISLDGTQTTGSSSLVEQTSLDTGLETDVLAIASASDLSGSNFSTFDEI